MEAPDFGHDNVVLRKMKKPGTEPGVGVPLDGV